MQQISAQQRLANQQNRWRILLAIALSSQLMLFRVEVSSNRSKSGEKSLGLSRGFESSHSSLLCSSRLMGILRPIVQSLVLSMLHVLQHLFLRR